MACADVKFTLLFIHRVFYSSRDPWHRVRKCNERRTNIFMGVPTTLGAAASALHLRNPHYYMWRNTSRHLFVLRTVYFLPALANCLNYIDVHGNIPWFNFIKKRFGKSSVFIPFKTQCFYVNCSMLQCLAIAKESE